MSSEHPKNAIRIRNLAVILLVLLPVSALGSRFGLWPYTTGFLLLALSLLGSLLIQIINAIWLLRKPTPKTKQALRWASVFALPPLVIVATLMRGNDAAKTGIHNISTDLTTPPQFITAEAQRGEGSNPLDYTADIAEIQSEFYPELAPINSPLPPQQAFLLAMATAEKLNWRIYSKNPTSGIIEAVDTTFWFGFKDDIVIRIQGADDGSRIDLRSVSRIGIGDLGANAKRIRLFQQLFTENSAKKR